jgi:hypothetical protein
MIAVSLFSSLLFPDYCCSDLIRRRTFTNYCHLSIMLCRQALSSPLASSFLFPATRAMSVWAGSLTLETPGSTHRSEDLDPPREADSEPSVAGWASSVTGGFFRAKDGSTSFPEVPNVSKPEKEESVWEAYRLMAVPKRKVRNSSPCFLLFSAPSTQGSLCCC